MKSSNTLLPLTVDKMEQNPIIHEVLTNLLLSAFEPNPVVFTAQYEVDLPRLRRAIMRAKGDNVMRLRLPVNRDSFLLACLDITDGEPIEHLIVGYGFKHGSTTKIGAIHHVLGSTHSVIPTPAVREAIRRQIQKTHRGEVVIFHNHPQSLLNALIDNLPLASSADRSLAEILKFNWFQLMKTIFGTGEVLLYVGENGFVKEFKLPPFNRIIQLLRLAGNFPGAW